MQETQKQDLLEYIDFLDDEIEDDINAGRYDFASAMIKFRDQAIQELYK